VTRLSELIERLNRLPEQKTRKNLNARVQSLTTKVIEAHSKLIASWRVRAFVQIVFPNEPFNGTAKAVRAASRQATALKEKLQGDFNEVTTEGTDKKVIRLGERAEEANDGVFKFWPSLMQRQIQPYKALTNVATMHKLPGSATLTVIMQRLSGCYTHPPATGNEAESIHRDLDALRKSIEKLGLEGEAGQFLIKAAQGAADPRELFKDEVKSFFDDQKLWNILVVKTK